MIAKIRILFWIGIILLFLPFFGIPNTWKGFIGIVIGVILIALSMSIKKGYKIMKMKLRRFEQPVVDQSIHG